MKKILSLVLALAMILSLSAMPSFAATEESEFTLVVARHGLDKSADYSDKIGAKMSEEKTGIKINYQTIEESMAAERINVMLGAGELPDGFVGFINASQLATNMPLFAILDDYLTEENTPAVMAMFEQYPVILEQITQTDGHIYSLPTGQYTNHENDGNSIQMINKAWLDKLYLEMPTNTEEFYEVCKAIKAGDPNGNGVADEIPVMFTQNVWASHFMFLMEPWGITEWTNGGNGYLKIDNGTVIFTPTLPEFRSALEYWHKFAEEGLLDVEGFTLTKEQFYARLKEYVCLAYHGWTPSTNFDTETAKEYVALPVMQASDYPEIKPVHNGAWDQYRANSTGFTVTAACKDPAKLVNWYDQINSDTASKWTWYLGEEGTLWEIEDGTVYELWPESVTIDFTRENMKYTYGAYGWSPVFILPYEASSYHEDAPEDATTRIRLVEAIKDDLLTEYFPKRNVDAEKLMERDEINVDLKAYLDSFVADAVVNGLDDAKWEKHIKDCEGYGAAEWTQWYQDFLDGKF